MRSSRWPLSSSTGTPLFGRHDGRRARLAELRLKRLSHLMQTIGMAINVMPIGVGFDILGARLDRRLQHLVSGRLSGIELDRP